MYENEIHSRICLEIEIETKLVFILYLSKLEMFKLI